MRTLGDYRNACIVTRDSQEISIVVVVFQGDLGMAFALDKWFPANGTHSFSNVQVVHFVEDTGGAQ
jgi:hypothetical protein